MLAQYDQRHRKKDRLLAALEVYLDCKGNMTEASERLEVHRNTVEQRLRRIHELTGIDVLDKKKKGLHFDLELALRLYKLRVRRGEAPPLL